MRRGPARSVAARVEHSYGLVAHGATILRQVETELGERKFGAP